MNIDEEKLRRLFKNNSDCFADTRDNDGNEGDVVMAVTEDRFIKVVKEYITSIKIGVIGNEKTSLGIMSAFKDKNVNVVIVDDLPPCQFSELPKMSDIDLGKPEPFIIRKNPDLPSMAYTKIKEDNRPFYMKFNKKRGKRK